MILVKVFLSPLSIFVQPAFHCFIDFLQQNSNFLNFSIFSPDMVLSITAFKCFIDELRIQQNCAVHI